MNELMKAINENDDIKQWEKFIKAIKAHDIEKVKFLIEAGVDINAKDYEMALHVAAWTGNIKIVRLLIEAGADVNIKDIEGKTPLVSSGGDINIVKLLVKAGADANIKDIKGKTPLDHAIDSYKSHKAFYKSKLFSKAIAELKEIVELLKSKE